MANVHCTLCARLVKFRAASGRRYPGYHAAPVEAFGDLNPSWLIVGLAPGMHGANRTGRPFTGDHAGILLFDTLHAIGASSAAYSISQNDGLQLHGVRITNAVKCLPPENKPAAAEARNCNKFLSAEIDQLVDVRVIVALGHIAHNSILDALGFSRSAYKFKHGAEYYFSAGKNSQRVLIDSYHCSRYNTQTKRLTSVMFKNILARAKLLAEL